VFFGEKGGRLLLRVFAVRSAGLVRVHQCFRRKNKGVEIPSIRRMAGIPTKAFGVEPPQPPRNCKQSTLAGRTCQRVFQAAFPTFLSPFCGPNYGVTRLGTKSSNPWLSMTLKAGNKRFASSKSSLPRHISIPLLQTRSKKAKHNRMLLGPFSLFCLFLAPEFRLDFGFDRVLLADSLASI